MGVDRPVGKRCIRYHEVDLDRCRGCAGEQGRASLGIDALGLGDPLVGEEGVLGHSPNLSHEGTREPGPLDLLAESGHMGARVAALWATSTQVVYELTTTRSVFSLRAERGGELQGRP